jgi:hypothetical protein
LIIVKKLIEKNKDKTFVDIGKTELVKWAVLAFKGLYSYYAYTSSGS